MKMAPTVFIQHFVKSLFQTIFLAKCIAHTFLCVANKSEADFHWVLPPSNNAQLSCEKY